MNILIVEDEILISEMLLSMLEELGHKVIGQAVKYDDALKILENEQDIDLIFCDINLNDYKNGIDLSREIHSKFKIPFIFLTSYADSKTVQAASENLPSGYLIKPFNKVTINASLIVEAEKLKLKSPHIFVFKGEIKTKVLIDEIDFIRTDSNYLEIHVGNEKFMERNSLDGFIEQFKNSSICRTHRSFAVNLKKVKAYTFSEIVFPNFSIPISRKYKNQVFERLKM